MRLTLAYADMPSGKQVAQRYKNNKQLAARHDHQRLLILQANRPGALMRSGQPNQGGTP
jgi:hypothetical protein